MLCDEVTEISFGPVSAKKLESWGWCIFDSRLVRQGARMMQSNLSFEDAFQGAAELSKKDVKR